MVSATKTKIVAGDGSKTEQEIKGKIVQYAVYLKNKGRSPESQRTYIAALYTLINKGANILDPLSVESVIASQESWEIRAQKNYVDWYSRFAKFLKIDWEKPLYKAPCKVPFFPLEQEIDQLIAGSSKKSSIAAHIAKETAARIGEIVKIKWIDIDFQTNTIAINQPEKNSNTGTYNVTGDLIARIQTLPRSSERIFGKASTDSLQNMWLAARKRLATSFCNPRLLEIHYHIIRHWKLTNYALATKDPYLVQMFARHKDQKSTSKYVHYEKIVYQKDSSQNGWTVRAAKTKEEATELMEVGFDPTGVEYDGFKLFRKRK